MVIRYPGGVADTPGAALIYGRQSLGKDKSISEQEEIGRERADDEGWSVHGVYADRVGASRHSRGTRADWPRLLADIERPEVGVLWLWESSRGDRSLTTWSGMLDRCREHGVRIFVETHERLYDMAKPRDWKVLAEDGIDSAYESDKISSRVARAAARKARRGEPHGRAPYGYRRRYGIDTTGKRVLLAQEPEAEQAKVVRRIFRDIARGVSLRAIAKDLNATGVPTVSGVPWSATRVRDIAVNPAYAGKRMHTPKRVTSNSATRKRELGTLTDATWQPLVSGEQFYDVRAILTDSKRRRTLQPGRAKHLLSMFMTCGVCGSPMMVRHDKYRGGGGETNYTCRAGGHVRIPQDDLDEYITGIIFERLADPATYAALANEDDSDRLRAARDELAELRAHHQDMVRLLATRGLSAQAFADAEPQVLADIAAVEARVHELETPNELRTLLGDPGRAIGKRWTDAPPVAKRRVVRLLFESIVVNRSPSPGHRAPITDRVEVTPTEGSAAAARSRPRGRGRTARRPAGR